MITEINGKYYKEVDPQLYADTSSQQIIMFNAQIAAGKRMAESGAQMIVDAQTSLDNLNASLEIVNKSVTKPVELEETTTTTQQ